QVPDDLMW
ncbi:MAG: hypothetical protein GWN66_07550, partial [Pseudomonas stutzeri]|nr:hypothetical protein [Stutzerimonas stutzeri]